MALTRLLAVLLAVGTSPYCFSQILPKGEINVPPEVVNAYVTIGSNTTLNLYEGGRIEGLFDTGIPNAPNTDLFVNVRGGWIGYYEAYAGAKVSVTEGEVSNLYAMAGSTVSIDGGLVQTLDAMAGSVVTVNGGFLHSLFAVEGGEVSINGGQMYGAYIDSKSRARVSGGAFRSFDAEEGSVTEFVGGDYHLNGQPYAGDSITLDEDDVFSGRLADGTSFLYGPSPWANLHGVSLTRTELPAVDTTPRVITESTRDVLVNLASGQELTLLKGGSIDNGLIAVDATLNVAGGQIGNPSGVSGSVVRVSDGSLGSSFNATDSKIILEGKGHVRHLLADYGSDVSVDGDAVVRDVSLDSGSSLRVTGGEVGPFKARSGSRVYLNGGVVEKAASAADSTVSVVGGELRSDFVALQGSVVNVGGGYVGPHLAAREGSTVNISGGTMGDYFHAYAGSAINITGRQFYLDGVPIEVSSGLPTVVQERAGVLSGLLADGSPFDLLLQPLINTRPGRVGFSPEAVLSLSLAPKPGDYDGDGLVSDSDYAIWRSSYGEYVTPYSGADGNGDGFVDLADYTLWSEHQTSERVDLPEPAGAPAAALAALTAVRRRTRA